MSQVILIVDDDVTSLKLAMSIIGKDYRVASAVSGAMALRYLEKNRPDLILLDLNMPEMDGLEVMERMQDNPETAGIPVVFLTATQSPQVEARCLEAGAIDFVSKPFIPQVLKSRVRRIIELYEYKDHLEQMVEEQSRELLSRIDQISTIQNAVIVGMANLIEERDNNSAGHIDNTQNYAGRIADALAEHGLYANVLSDEYRDILVKAVPLHDVGKIKIPDSILQREGRLSDEEYRIMHSHTRLGSDIIEEMLGDVAGEKYIKVAGEVALSHHERWDGSGYPEGLRGEEIPLAARIVAVADAYDKLCDDNAKAGGGRSEDELFAIMKESAGTKFDPAIIEAFMTLKGRL